MNEHLDERRLALQHALNIAKQGATSAPADQDIIKATPADSTSFTDRLVNTGQHLDKLERGDRAAREHLEQVRSLILQAFSDEMLPIVQRIIGAQGVFKTEGRSVIKDPAFEASPTYVQSNNLRLLFEDVAPHFTNMLVMMIQAGMLPQSAISSMQQILAEELSRKHE